MESSVQLILEELRALRVEVRQFRDELTACRGANVPRLVQLEAWVKPALVNNGQPSRIAAVEQRVSALEKNWTKVAAVGAAIWGALAIALHFLPWGKH